MGIQKLACALVVAGSAFVAFSPNARALNSSHGSSEAVEAADAENESAPDVFLFSSLQRSSTNSWQGVIDRPGTAGILFGVELFGPSPYARNAELRFKPASTSKLFTAGATLAAFGADYRFETRLEWNRLVPGSDEAITGLRLVGSGDPSWGMEEFGEDYTTRTEVLANRLRALGVREIRGELELAAVDPRWSGVEYPDGWELQDHVQCYGALGQAFNLQINCATFVLRGPTQGAWEEYGISTPVTLDIRRGSRTNVVVEQTPQGFAIRGTWAARTPAVTYYLPIRDVAPWVKALFIRSLARNGIYYYPTANAAGFEGEGSSITFYSAPLSEILKPFMKKSLNMMGDALFKALGARSGAGQPDLVAAGQEALRAYAAQAGVESEALLLDGSGLSHESRVTPRAMTRLLGFVNESAYFPAVWESLAIAGVDGTLKARMKGTRAEGILRGKTGTLRGSYNLSGYVPRIESDGSISSFTPFVILTQTTEGKAANARAAHDRVGAELSRIVNSQTVR